MQTDSTPKKKRRKPQTSISLPPDLLAEVDALAAASSRTRTLELEWLVRRGLEQERKSRKKFTETP